MFACLAAAALAAAPLTLPAKADAIRVEAAALQALPDPTLAQSGDRLEAFSAASLALSADLRAAGAASDLPCIFKGIGEDAAAQAAKLQGGQDPFALAELRVLLEDAEALAPQAAKLTAAPDPHDLLNR